MDIADTATTEFVSVDPDTTVSKLRGTFDSDLELRTVVVTEDGDPRGVVTERQLVSSHHEPNRKAESVIKHPPTVERTEDVREVARLMVENEVKLLLVTEADDFYGVVTARDLIHDIRPNLDALSVADVATQDVVTVDDETTLGEVVNTIRTNGFSRVPVVENGDVRGMVSVHDLVDFTTRTVNRQEGGSAKGFGTADAPDAELAASGTGGRGERRGDMDRMLDLPARDVMNAPAATTAPDRSLADAADEMLEKGYDSLVVVEDGQPTGIVTVTDVLRSLTWTPEEHIDVQVFNVEYLTDIDKDAIAERIEEIDAEYADMDVIETNAAFQRHREQMRGEPLLRAKIRLFTDEGRFMASGEGYGARAAFDEAADVLEENVLEQKGRSDPRQLAEHERDRAAELLDWWREGVQTEE